MRQAIAQTTTFCTQKGIDFAVLESAQGFARTKFWADAVECIIINDDVKKTYLSLTGNVNKLYKAILPDPNVQMFFQDLINFAQELGVEDKRAIAKNLTEEELAIFDLLTKPEIQLTKQEEQEVKQVARELLKTLKKEKLVLDWKKRQQTRASVEVAIKDGLDRLPQSYSAELYEQKCQEVYQHIYENYSGKGSIYDASA